jgi:5'-3' exonuclease
MTPDKDLGQCLVGRRVVQVDRMRDRELDEEGLVALRGIRPASIPDWLALTGDTADGVPGLAGFGEKSAAALLARFGHIEEIPDDPSAWPPSVRGAPRLARTLAAARAEALLYRSLTRLCIDVPLGEPLEALRWSGLPAGGMSEWRARFDRELAVDRPRRS